MIKMSSFSPCAWKRTLLPCLLVLTCLCASAAADPAKRLLRKAGRYLEALPASMPGAEHDTPEKATLGRRLFFEKRLSINNTQSCASCHKLDSAFAGTDKLATSPGANGQKGTRNSPTVLNAGYQFAQFWDGRAKDLVEQAKQPILNPVEMGMPDERTVENKLRRIPKYRQAFAKAFPADAEPITYQNLAEAIAAFERTLRTETRLDAFLNGDMQALNKAEQKGLKTFLRVNCQSCHDGPLLGGGIFERLGQRDKKYTNESDLGLFEVTKKEDDKYFFKVPTLLNIALTPPYFHDGQVTTLREAVKLMGELQLEGPLSDREIDEIVVFLQALKGAIPAMELP